MTATAAMLARLAAVGLAAGVFVASAARRPPGVDFTGVNDAKMAWRSPEARAAVVEALGEAGASHVRLMAVRPLEAVADAAAALGAKGIGVLVMVPLGQPDFFGPATAARPADGVHYELRPTAEMDLRRFETFMSEVLTILDARGIRPEAVELGNEINISPFEPTLPVVPGGIMADAANFGRQSFAGPFGQALDRYVDALRRTRRLLQGRGVPLLLASVVGPEGGWAAEHGVTVVAPELCLRMLLDRGAADIVDGFALHLYPQVTAREKDPEEAVRAAVDAAFDPLARLVGPGRRWWITEWGFARSVGRDSGMELPRGPRMKAFAAAINGRPEARLSGPAFLYDFADDELFRIHGQDAPSDPDALLTISRR
ncbi:hypothetical protein PQI07_25510 [Methylobacterium sp. 092160098-2]|uniref:hypothetical protein n=1 Tax=Methylobacterium sp. 092160098-2 TaxID=3025129 RepID=UPI002381C5B1|nr:hypothetical protein [Methylobacterium sp. 092160098-2]MDE4914032.1 hypothetical protein [Methylobacterium sp. 092160098-2]